MALQRSHQTEDCAAEGRLSGPIGSYNPHELAGMNLEGDILKCNYPREPKGGMIEVNDGERLTCHVGEDSSQSKPLGKDAYQPLGWIQRVGQLEHIITEH